MLSRVAVSKGPQMRRIKLQTAKENGQSPLICLPTGKLQTNQTDNVSLFELTINVNVCVYVTLLPLSAWSLLVKAAERKS